MKHRVTEHTIFSGRQRLTVTLAAIVLATTGTLAFATQDAHGATDTVICNSTWSGQCLNRSGGATAYGTHVIPWRYTATNENFRVGYTTAGCGGYVRNGENGCLGPFTNGSGLNKALDGSPIVRVISGGACVVPHDIGSHDIAVLGRCNAYGVYYVFSRGSHELVDIDVSNAYFKYYKVTKVPYGLCVQFSPPRQIYYGNSNSTHCEWKQF